MSDENAIEYDFGNVLTFLTGIQTLCGLMAGFVFAGTTVILGTLTEPPTLLEQIILFVLFFAMEAFTTAIYELHNMKCIVCSQSSKRIIPSIPARWRIINGTTITGNFLAMVSIPLMFLLKGLIPLFVLSMCWVVLGSAYFYFRRWKPVEEEMRRRATTA